MRTPRVAVLASVPALVLGWALAGCDGSSAPAPSCAVTVPGAGRLVLDPEQAADAATIAGVARRLGLPDHAVTVALATALQESGLRNLDSGDLDSLGLFQQRPSQGWGTPEQIRRPSYAAAAFYRRLVQLPGWVDLPVTVAAQAVQRSAHPEAYGQHEDDARLLARGTTGQVPAALACAHLPRADGLQSDGLARAAVADLGPQGLAPSDTGGLWSAASWLVAHAQTYGVTSVVAGGRRWTAATGSWTAGGAPPRLTWS